MDPTKDNTKSREEDNQPMRFANATLGKHRHVCAFFHGAEEEYRVLLPFVKEGLARGEKAFHIVDPKLRDEHLDRLPQAASMSLRSRRMDNSSCTIGTKFICVTVISTRTECLPACRRYWSRASTMASPSPASWATPNGLQATGPG